MYVLYLFCVCMCVIVFLFVKWFNYIDIICTQSNAVRVMIFPIEQMIGNYIIQFAVLFLSESTWLRQRCDSVKTIKFRFRVDAALGRPGEMGDSCLLFTIRALFTCRLVFIFSKTHHRNCING